MKDGFTIMFDLQGYERGIRHLTNEERRYVAIEVLLQCFDYRVSRNVTVRGAYHLSAEDLELARREIEGQFETFDRIFSAEYTGSCWNEGLTRLYRDDKLAYIQTAYPTFLAALDRITTDLNVPFIGGLHRRSPLRLQWVMSDNPGFCINIDISIDAVDVSNSWDDEVVILKWPAWLLAGRDRTSPNPPTFEDIMHLIMLPIHRMIHESAGDLWEVGELENSYKILNYSRIVVDLCTGGEALMINESPDYETLLSILPSMDPTYETRKAAAKEQA